jgi:hypothetical protein
LFSRAESKNCYDVEGKPFEYVLSVYVVGKTTRNVFSTIRMVAGSNPDEVDFFNLPNPSSRTMALGLTQPLTEMSTRNISGGKGRLAR